MIHPDCVYGPELIDLMRRALEAAWSELPADTQASASKSLMAEKILRAAAVGERDMARLQASALRGNILEFNNPWRNSAKSGASRTL
jgi:hypothetical protein